MISGGHVGGGAGSVMGRNGEENNDSEKNAKLHTFAMRVPFGEGIQSHAKLDNLVMRVPSVTHTKLHRVVMRVLSAKQPARDATYLTIHTLTRRTASLYPLTRRAGMSTGLT